MEPVAWQCDAGLGLKRYVTDRVYQKFAKPIQDFYRPYSPIKHGYVAVPAASIEAARLLHRYLVNYIETAAPENNTTPVMPVPDFCTQVPIELIDEVCESMEMSGLHDDSSYQRLKAIHQAATQGEQ